MPKKKQYCYPFPRPSVSVDIVVFREGDDGLEILLIKRKNAPFKGWWAIPGGFVDENESLGAAAKRELEEETGLRGVRLEQLAAFGDPGRDPRGHTVSVAHLGFARRGAKVKGADDAEGAEWFPIAHLPKLGFDHPKIIRAALKKMLRSG
jgi:8-oxo-dGTP diphosphatase